MMDPEIAREFKRLQNMLSKLVENQQKGAWAKVGFLADLTGWDREKIRQARDQGLIEWKNDPVKGRLYNLNSIPKILLIPKNENTTTGGGKLAGTGAILNQTEKVK